GPFVERVLGVARYLVTYFIAGLGPGLVMVLVAKAGLMSMGAIAVGASGAIMGLLGAEAAIMLRAWRVNKSLIVRRQLLWILMITALQSVFDLAALSVGSLLAHLSGVLFGFITSSLLRHRASRSTIANTT